MQCGSDQMPLGRRPAALHTVCRLLLTGRCADGDGGGPTAQQLRAVSGGGWELDRLSKRVADAACHGRMIARVGAARGVEPSGAAYPREIEGMPSACG